MKIPRRLAAVALLLASCAVPGTAASARAQTDSVALELEQLQTPTSPAFVILGVSPTAVERPTTPRAFALSVVQAATESDDLVPDNYAAEFAPYWLGPQRELTFLEYFRPSVGQALQQTFSLSFATNTVLESGDSLPALGAGFRFAPFVGGPSRRLDSLSAAIDSIDSRLLTLRIALRRAATAADSAAIQTQITARSDTAQALASQLRAAISTDDERVGFRLQFAGGLAAYYPGNQFTAGKIGRTGVWATAGYRLERPSVDLIALGRYLRNEEGTDQRALDVGGRAVLLFTPWAASLEWVARSASGGEGPGPDGTPGFASGNRAVGMLEYRVNDDLYVNFSFGQDYAQSGEEGQPLVAILGGQINLGKNPLISLPVP
ncbi:MAG TPA: hypothetical protein VFR37_14435 [Longimicrobium sp.]|nr:hypothetical protein [Longimicrobium sp.]